MTNNMQYETLERLPEEFDEDKFMVEIDNLLVTEKIMNEKFSFLKSTRFMALVIGALMFYLKTKNIIGEPEMILVNTILGGFIGIRTVDRFGDSKVEAAKVTGSVTTVSMPSNVSSVQATTSTPTENTGSIY